MALGRKKSFAPLQGMQFNHNVIPVQRSVKTTDIPEESEFFRDDWITEDITKI